MKSWWVMWLITWILINTLMTTRRIEIRERDGGEIEREAGRDKRGRERERGREGGIFTIVQDQ